MTTRFRFRHIIVTLTVLGVVNPLTAFGQSPTTRRIPRQAIAQAADAMDFQPSKPEDTQRLEGAKVHDIRLDQRQQFHGVVVDGEGRALTDRVVQLRRTASQADAAVTRTDEHGRFQFSRVKAGTYQLETEQGVSLCRLWTFDAAPPAAAPSLLVVDDPLVERGQRPLGELFVMDPVLMATVVAAAVAIPVVIHKSRDDAPPGS